MRSNEERSSHGSWDGDDRPDPMVAQSAAEFVAQLRALLQWSGLSLYDIELLAKDNGDILPQSIVSTALGHNTLPPPEVVVALVRAIGCDEPTVELWASVLWRLEEAETVAVTRPESPAQPRHGAGMRPESPPPPQTAMTRQESPAPPPPRQAAGSRQYSGGALAEAVQKRRNQDSWTGLHRDFGEGSHGNGFAARFRWPAPVAIGAAIFVIVAASAWMLSGIGEGDDNASPAANANPCCVGGSGGSGDVSAGPQAESSPGAEPLLSIGGTRPTLTQTPKTTPTGARTSPTPAQTQAQQKPTLSGSGNGTCDHQGTEWWVDVAVTATLTGAAAGSDPQGQAGKSGDLKSFAVSGSGGTSFSGQASINVGPDSTPAQGTIQWIVSVTVAGVGTVTGSGSVSYNCGA